jgi:hypothetical protein
VLLATDKAYQLKWQGGTTSWEMKRRMDSDYSIVEDITMIANDLSFDWLKDNILDFKGIKLPHFFIDEMCDNCGGTGKVDNTEITSCYKTCPVCNGSGRKSKKVTLSFD